VLGYDTTGDGRLDAFDTNQDGRFDVHGRAPPLSPAAPDAAVRGPAGISICFETIY
jgi:hypothetical protein